jgi:hypothetical protein
MSDEASKTIQVTCPCCSAVLTVDPSLSAVLEHKLPLRPVIVDDLKNAAQFVKDEATKRDEKYQQIVEAEKNRLKVVEAKFQKLFKKAKEEPITKPLKDIDLD